MFYRPLIQPIAKTTVEIDAFGGYDHNLRIADGSLYDMKNLTSDNFPVLTPRKQRGTYWPDGWENQPTNVIGACAGAFVKKNGNGGGNLVIGDTLIKDLGLNAAEKTIIRNGAYLLIFPDKKYFSTPQTADIGALETEFTHEQGHEDGCHYFFRVYDKKGRECTELECYGVPENPTEGCIAFESNGDDNTVKQWNSKTEKWETVGKLYFRLIAGIGSSEKLELFNKTVKTGDVLVLTDFNYYDDRQYHSSGVTESPVFTAEKTYVTAEDVSLDRRTVRMYSVNDAESIYRLISAWGYFREGLTDEQNDERHADFIRSITMERVWPTMDFVIECNNRLWGCRYGENHYGDFVNEIYAAKQGDFRNWNTFSGISTDSYVASCGASGPFTGAVNFNGRPLFFKENHYYLVSGDYPSEYGYSEGPIKGVQNGSGKSLVVIDRVVYYKGVDGVYAFDGYSATCISAALGDVYYKNARAGAYRNKYYITMQDDNDVWHLFVYDTKKGLWHKEDNQQADFFYTDGNVLYFVSGGFIQSVDAETLPQMVRSDTPEPPVEWMAETGNLTTGIPYKKYLAKLNVRMKVHQGASVRIFIQYDESGKWEELFYMTATKQRSFTIPIRPKRCDHIKLKLTGVGDVEVYSIIKTLEKGSDL